MGENCGPKSIRTRRIRALLDMLDATPKTLLKGASKIPRRSTSPPGSSDSKNDIKGFLKTDDGPPTFQSANSAASGPPPPMQPFYNSNSSSNQYSQFSNPTLSPRHGNGPPGSQTTFNPYSNSHLSQSQSQATMQSVPTYTIFKQKSTDDSHTQPTPIIDNSHTDTNKVAEVATPSTYDTNKSNMTNNNNNNNNNVTNNNVPHLNNNNNNNANKNIQLIKASSPERAAKPPLSPSPMNPSPSLKNTASKLPPPSGTSTNSVPSSASEPLKSALKPPSVPVDESKKSPLTAPTKQIRKQEVHSHWNLTDIYLLYLNILLSLGILVTIIALAFLLSLRLAHPAPEAATLDLADLLDAIPDTYLIHLRSIGLFTESYLSQIHSVVIRLQLTISQGDPSHLSRIYSADTLRAVYDNIIKLITRR